MSTSVQARQGCVQALHSCHIHPASPGAVGYSLWRSVKEGYRIMIIKTRLTVPMGIHIHRNCLHIDPPNTGRCCHFCCSSWRSITDRQNNSNKTNSKLD